MVLPTIYRKGSSATANYDFLDLATGVGYKTFYAGKFMNGANTKTNILTTENLYSTDLLSVGGSNTASDLDFDIVFITPLTIGGNVNFHIPFALWVDKAGAVDFTLYGKLYLVRGGVETQLGSTVSIIKSHSSAWAWYIWAGTFAVPTTVLSSGDTLRFNIVVDAAGVDTYHAIYHDPANRTIQTIPTGTTAFTGLTSRTAVNIPIKIDL